jgi:hypothetical protein
MEPFGRPPPLIRSPCEDAHFYDILEDIIKKVTILEQELVRLKRRMDRLTPDRLTTDYRLSTTDRLTTDRLTSPTD